MHNLFVYSFYKFKNIKNITHLKNTLDNFLKEKEIKGTVLVAKEGINGTISGLKKDLDECIKLLKVYLKIRNLEIKINKTKFFPFNRMKVRLKNEIVSLGQGDINVNKYRAKLIDPKTWNSLISDEKIKVIDVRNEFEIAIGNFTGSINPKTKSFRCFPSAIKKLNINKNDKIAMYCTGGIRCEKASAYLKLKGFKNVYQLNGGIINYLDYFKDKRLETLWNGECFVFDQRVTIKKDLEKGSFFQCYGCRRPITKKDIESNKYKKGVHCPYCFNKRTKKQKKGSEDRQKQIDNNLKIL